MKVTVFFLLLLQACAFQRASVRVLPDYRSQETYGAAHWGMTPEEVSAAVPNLIPCGTHMLCRDEFLRERLAHATYGFPKGQLAYVVMRVDSPAPGADFDAMREDLVQAYGKALAPNEAAQVLQDLADLASALFGRDLSLGLPIAWGRALWKTAESEVMLISPFEGGGNVRLILSSRTLRP